MAQFAITAACAAAFFTVYAMPSSAAQIPISTPSPYRVLESIKLAGPVRWDYVVFAPESQQLFLSRSDHVDVYDTKAKRLRGTVTDTPGIHGIAIAPALNRGFTSNGHSDSVSVFALDTLKTLATVPVGKQPDAIIYDAFSKRIFTANEDGQSLSAIDAVSLKVLGTIALPGKPEFAVADGLGTLYVNIQTKNQIAVVDTKSLKISSSIDVSKGCVEPTGLAIDVQKRRLFASCQNQKMAIVDIRTGTLLITVDIGKDTDGAGFDSTLSLAFSANGTGTLSVIAEDKPGHFILAQTLTTMPSARTLALDAASHKIYLPAAEREPGNSGHKAKADSFRVLVIGL